MTTTTVLHTAVAREISRIRRHLGSPDSFTPLHLEAHELADALTRAVAELIEHARAAAFAESLN